MNEKEMHADHRSRMYKRVAETGLEGFYDHEALEYLLYFVLPRVDTNPVAHRLIERFGSFAQVMEADEKDLCRVDGIGPASARYIHSMLLFYRYYQQQKAKSEKVLNSCEKLVRYCIPLFYGIRDERLYLLSLDDSFKLLGCSLVEEGTVNSVSMPIRKIAETALRFRATNVVLTHNHPQGIALPSSEDLKATKLAAQSLKPLGIVLADHIIVSGEEGTSLHQSGKL